LALVQPRRLLWRRPGADVRIDLRPAGDDCLRTDVWAPADGRPGRHARTDGRSVRCIGLRERLIGVKAQASAFDAGNAAQLCATILKAVPRSDSRAPENRSADVGRAQHDSRRRCGFFVACELPLGCKIDV